MPLNLDVLGRRFGPSLFSYDRDDVILYALGVGAGVDELDFVYEKRLKVYPTFAAAPLMGCIFNFIKDSNINLAALLHGEQKVVLHREIPVSGTVRTTYECKSIYDKGKNGAVLNLHLTTVDEKDEVLFENIAVLFDRSAGDFGGDPGPKSEKIAPPADAAPDMSIKYQTSPNQAALYRLCGDKNPLHIDPGFARKGGFDKPILHGLCTYGFAGRAILEGLCGNDPARLKSFAVRFTGVVFPGDALITEAWKMDDHRYVVQTKTGEGRVVLGAALAEIA
ncbi:MAG: MaoC/PaaZ C-terminal domain-containing protein [Pseudomonadota bacterium]